jgi:hypothetical protein
MRTKQCLYGVSWGVWRHYICWHDKERMRGFHEMWGEFHLHETSLMRGYLVFNIVIGPSGTGGHCNKGPSNMVKRTNETHTQTKQVPITKVWWIMNRTHLPGEGSSDSSRSRAHPNPTHGSSTPTRIPSRCTKKTTSSSSRLRASVRCAPAPSPTTDSSAPPPIPARSA